MDKLITEMINDSTLFLQMNNTEPKHTKLIKHGSGKVEQQKCTVHFILWKQ